MKIIKVPSINGLGRTKGCRNAGNALLESLREVYSNESGKEVDVDLLNLGEISLDNSNLVEANELIYRNSFKAFQENIFSIFLGGDHSASYPLCRAFLDFCQTSEKEPCLIVFDAHPDCMKPIDGKFPTHEEWIRGLIEAGFPSRNILLVGLRNSDVSELSYIKEKGIKTILMKDFLGNLEDVCDGIMEFSNGRELYVSLDIDVVDPAFAPSTGYCEPGGFSSREILYLVSRLKKIKTLRAVDLVEINTEEDFSGLTKKLGAKILGELL
jgi:arginase family enzyme